MAQPGYAGLFGLSWYFQIDAGKVATQAKIYITEQTKANLEHQDEVMSQNKLSEEQAMMNAMGGARAGYLDTNDYGRARRQAIAAETLKLQQEARAFTKEEGAPDNGYDVYLAQVTQWRAALETYRARADALAAEANSRPLTLLEWQSMHTQYRLLMGELAAAKAAAASQQAEEAAQLLRDRAALQEQLLMLKRLRN